ncbi:class I SAM-dependent methyltransferase [Nocardia bovistercoris]|uniref:Class I SAM-dependent methyltransferase n=1 Tax=Nocardia bovistercoris TaxID=2785916 RepID=A0A931N1Z0_9NOCA|nr:class I SAM-dependent methyltransferase [Nocardia bovistercoris]MBH0778940.1 class I SAM-dependent methyltransferase [Nocardia bovistercoris]
MSANPLTVAEPWDLVAESYAEFGPAVMRPFSSHALEVAGPAPDARIVDIAAGTGILSLLAARQVASVHAIDLSEGMLERLREAARQAGIDNIETECGDGQALPFESNRFDAAFSMFGLIFFPDRTAGFAEMFRVLRPGGLAVVSSWAPMVESPLMMTMFAAGAAADPDLQEPQPDFLGLENPDVFATEMRAAGFAGVTIQRHTASIHFDSVDEIWASMIVGSAMMQWIRRQEGERRWAARTAAMRGYLDANFRPGVGLSTTALLGIGHKPRL